MWAIKQSFFDKTCIAVMVYDIIHSFIHLFT